MPLLRTCLTVSGDRAVHDASVEIAHVFIAETVARHRSGAQILYDDISGFREFAKNLLPLGSAQIQGHRFLIGVYRQEPGMHAAFAELGHVAAPAISHRIPDAWILDFYHVGAEQAELISGERTRQNAADLENFNSLERTIIGHD
jgi:hypothetical protein